MSLAFLSQRPLRKVWVAIGVTVAALSGFCGEEGFAIRLGRHPARIGREFQMKVEFQQSYGSAFDSETRQQQTNTTSCVELLARCKVLENAAGSESLELVIERLTDRQGTNSNALLPPGSVVIAKTVAGEWSFKLAHGHFSLAVTKVLEELLGSASDDMPCTPDQAFGTPERKQIGDTWKGNAECLTNGFNKYFGIVDPNQFDVTMKLVGAEEVASTKCLRLGLSIFIHTDQPVARIAKDPRTRLFGAKWDTKLQYERINLLPVSQDLPNLRMEEKGEAISRVKLVLRGKVAALELRFTGQKTVEINLLN
jgi:hypothetical protein